MAAAPTSSSHSTPPWWLAAGFTLAAFALAFLVYGPALHGTFLWDDDGHITKPALRSLGGLARIWFELGATQQYYPVLHSAFWVEHFLFGTKPTGYHVVNVLQHALAACLFAALLRRLKVSGAWLAAFLFLLHPVCVESVAWISEQKNTLSTVFYLLAALAYLRFHDSRGVGQYLLATGLFVLALGTKTVTGTLPAALLVIFWWQRGRLDLRREIVPLAPWFALAAGAGVLTASVEHTLIGAAHNEFDLTLVEHALLASRVIWFYLGKLFFPVDLMFIYPRWTIDAAEAWQYLFLLGLLALGFAGWRWRHRRGPIAAGLLFAGSLFPALGFVNVYPFVFSFVADHFQYLASLAIFALAGAGLTLGLGRWARPPRAIALLALLSALAVLTWRQSAIYSDVFTLYSATLAKNPGAWMAHNNLGNALVGAGRAREAIPHLEAAVKLRPQSAEAENNLGYARLALREVTAAIGHFERAQRLRPDYVYAYNNLGLALMNTGRPAEAEAQFQAALKLKPEYLEPHLNLGLLMGQTNRPAEAVKHFREAVRLQPQHPDAVFNLAIALTQSGQFTEAYPHFERAVRLAPTRPDMRFSFGRALALGGRTAEAVAHYREALKFAPDFADAHYGLGLALRELGRPEEAARHFAEASRLGFRN